MRTALFQPATHAFHLDSKSDITKTLLEPSIFPGRPHGKDSTGLESGETGS